jgi:hypothetical protein
MEVLKEVLATLVFILGLVLLAAIDFEMINWFEIIGAIVCLGLAYLLWPSKNRGQRESNNMLLDVIEFLIELPVDIVSWLFKLLSKLFRNKEGGADLDIDF